MGPGKDRSAQESSDATDRWDGTMPWKALCDRAPHVMAGRYQRLRRYLEALRGNEWQATFDQIERVIGSDLPPSARNHPAWWSNTTSHSQALAWMKAGWITRKVTLAERSVVFERKPRGSLPDTEGKRQVLRRRGIGGCGSNSGNGSTDHSTPQPTPADSHTLLVLLGQPFIWVARIQPETRKDGIPRTDMPQKRYANAAQKRLNRHGAGPFCRFDVNDLPDTSGIYAVTLNGKLAYVGIAVKSLKQRWGSQGYGRISPRNCYVGGQSTNCKINHAILRAVRQKQIVDLWIHEMEWPRTLERHLIRELDPPWNDQG